MTVSGQLSQGRLRTIAVRLRRHYRPSRLHNKRDPLSELLFILLSSQTEEYNYVRTYRLLRRRFRSWRRVALASENEVFHAIRGGGLGRKKSRQILAALAEIGDHTGNLSLDFLREWPDNDTERYLTSIPGIGLKSARCIMLFALDREVFPVDAHVWRVWWRLTHVQGTKRMPTKPTSAIQQELQSHVPRPLRGQMHVGMVKLGRDVCRDRAPRCDRCSIRDLCRTGQTAFEKGALR